MLYRDEHPVKARTVVLLQLVVGLASGRRRVDKSLKMVWVIWRLQALQCEGDSLGYVTLDASTPSS